MEATLRFREEGDAIVFELFGSGPGVGDGYTVRTRVADTKAGTEHSVQIIAPDGTVQTVRDMTDRSTPPLIVLDRALKQLEPTLLTVAQAAFNTHRLKRLTREGAPINMQTMCMDGHHTGDEYAQVPFKGGIVGLGEPEDVARVKAEVEGPKADEPKAELSPDLEAQLRGIFNDDEGTDLVEA